MCYRQTVFSPTPVVTASIQDVRPRETAPFVEEQWIPPVIGPPGGLSPGPAAVSPTKRSDVVKPFAAACRILATNPPSIPSTHQTKPRRFCQLQSLRVSNHFSRPNRHPRLCIEIRKVAILASETISLRCHASVLSIAVAFIAFDALSVAACGQQILMFFDRVNRIAHHSAVFNPSSYRQR